MGIPAGVARVSFRGHQGASEIFDVSYWITTNVSSQAEADALAADRVAAFEANNTHPRSLIGADSGYDECRVYVYNDGGPAAAFIGTASMAGQTGTGDETGPLQMCMVVTLLTGAAGRRRRGRMYFPASGAALSSHLFQPGDVTGLANDVAGMFTDTAPVVVSQVGTSAADITSVRVDNKPDIQRRRANQLAATQTFEKAVVHA